jgi:NAD(P)H-hydrate epimerase
MKILTAEQMRRIDRLTAERAGISTWTLMENAGRQLVDFLLHDFGLAGQSSSPTSGGGSDPVRISILCGKGNNGGDGLVAARLLLEQGLRPHVVLFAAPDELKGDAQRSYEEFVGGQGEVESVTSTDGWEKIRDATLACDVLVDGLLGTGLTGPARGFMAQVVSDINAQRPRFRILAVDIPSGLPSDGGEPVGEAVTADATVTFTAPKLAQIFPPNCLQVGRLAVAPIGTPNELYEDDPELSLNLITTRQFSPLGLARDVTAHKGSYGHVLLVSGSRGKTGAAALGGKAALRMGAGLSTVATPSSSLPIVASLCPEIMTEPLAETDAGTISNRALDYGGFAKLAEGKTVLAMGPGLTTHPETVQFVRTVVRQFSLPLVLDADALNALVGQLEALRERRAEKVVVTPHPGEMARLLGVPSAEIQRQRVEVAQKFAREFGVFVILKGHRTLVASPSGQVYVNPTGNPGMATGGSGDVLTGLVAGAIAQWPQADLEDVLSLAVYLHGLAGDVAAGEQGEQAVIASDILEAMPRAWTALGEKIERDSPGSYYIVP